MACLLLIVASSLYARPVSYPGGVTIMQMNNANENMLHINYTFSPKSSAGIFSIYDREDEYLVNSIILNNRFFRLNEKYYQANAYIENAIGALYSYKDEIRGKSSAYAMTGFSADAENRRFYGAYENHYHISDREEITKNFFEQKLRAGVAPYIGDYGNLHTWLILELTHKPKNEDNFTLTPFFRFFKGDVLTEIGANEEGKVLFNLIYRF